MDLKTSKKNRLQKADLDDFIKITDTNRKHAIKIGTTIYIIDNKRIKHKMIVRPRMVKGSVMYSDSDPHFKELKIVNGESEEEYVSNFKPILDMVISAGTAYIKKGEKLITYSVKL